MVLLGRGAAATNFKLSLTPNVICEQKVKKNEEESFRSFPAARNKFSALQSAHFTIEQTRY